MDPAVLVGSWSAASGDSHLEFRRDGTYLRVSSFVMPMTYEAIALDDQGPYAVHDDVVTFTPTAGHYRRNGIDEGFDSRVREQRARLEGDGAGASLFLDDSPWSRSA